MFKYEDRKYPAELLFTISGANDDSLPDGAWWAVLESTAEQWINDNKKWKHLDANDSVHAYLNNQDGIKG